MRPLYVNVYPLLIGLTFLAPTDVTFSVWFFLLLNKIELVTTAIAGWGLPCCQVVWACPISMSKS